MFKKHIQADIQNTFMNVAEFVEAININGVFVDVVEDSDKLEYKIKRDYDGMVVGDVLFYISNAEYLKIPMLNHAPTPNQALTYKNQHYIIISSQSNCGIHEIILQGRSV